MDLAITEVANDVVRISEKVNERVYLVESAVNDDGSWYRKHSDGWIEQGGMIASGGGSAITVTFLIPFASTMYHIVKNPRYTTSNTAYYSHLYCYNCTMTTFTTSNLADTSWYACGMGGIV